MAKALGIGGVFFKTKDPKGLLVWYQKWLGFPDGSDEYAMFMPATMPQGAGTVFSPFPSGTDYFARPNQGPMDREDAQGFMINLVVDDLSMALQQVKSGGAEIVGDTQHEDFGDFGWFIDPAGNKVEMWEPK
jgi:uncharacterized glyoxalase superfamily protein PhnB